MKMKSGSFTVALGAVAVFAILVIGSTPSFAAGDALFKAKCVMCHGATGAADTPMGKNLKIRDLSSEDVQKQSDAEISDIIAKGKNKMPAVGKAMKPEEVKDLVAFIRTLKK